jgi:Domain of unknown function (DUF1707)/2TM domain
MCHSRRRVTMEQRDRSSPARTSDSRGDSRTGTPVPTATRVGDSEREQVMRLLADAFADGRLTREEFDARVADALVARTGADLAPLTGDLEPTWLADRGQARRSAPRAARATKQLRSQARSYIAVMLLLVTIWLMIGLAAQSWYPWFIWPALGWGISIAARLKRTARTSATPP